MHPCQGSKSPTHQKKNLYARADAYANKHPGESLARRLSYWRYRQIVRRALKQASEPNLVLDLPCGRGRLWPLLAEQSNRVILAADKSSDMLAMAQATQPAHVLARIRIFQTSVFDIDLSDNSVDSIFCMHFLHRFGASEHRLAMLREFHRVARDTLIVSLWVDGNYEAWRRKRLPKKVAASEGRDKQQKCFVTPKTTIESEFKEVGFQILAHQNCLPGLAMWRVYVLRKAD
ncbi:class I SAM-dependent methyltransferase [Pseudomonas sp. 2FG]|uniref:class I SAM-dependent methyltransferase n=1 Tax=Pseudomonas sp. 2FG TaxID=2502191 RepID=UPI0010F9EA95|nr:class I SAM-dependent methyltransferase [Pseudomonas sp. 2FG]